MTFILKGSLAHHDTGGHLSIIEAGGVQWMTAGRGLIHAEVSPGSFKQSGGPLEILQLWVNLPARLKMTEPRYTGLQRQDIPALPLPDGGTLRRVSDEYEGITGQIRSLTDVFMSVVQLDAGGGTISGDEFERWHLAEMAPGPDTVEITAAEPTTLLFGHADPIDEPMVARGPFVMNTPKEINHAIRDYQAGVFNGTGELLQVGA